MKNTLEGVKQFHETYGLPVKDAPDLSDQRTNALRIGLLQEELNELKEALDAGNEKEVLDALTDLLVRVRPPGAELEPAVGQLVQHRRTLGRVDRMVGRQDAHAEADPDPPGHLAQRAEQHLGAG